jgi:hypothetical protein
LIACEEKRWWPWPIRLQDAPTHNRETYFPHMQPAMLETVLLNFLTYFLTDWLN